MIFCSPPTGTRVEPVGSGTPFTMWTVVPPFTKAISTVTGPAYTLHMLRPIIVAVVEAGAVYTVVAVTPMFADTAFLNVDAIFYPNAMA